MPKSMTGYGRSEFKTEAGVARIEIKTTNHRYFEFSSRLPYSLASFDEKIRKAAQNRIKRGKIHISITAPDTILRKGKLYIDEELAKEYHKASVKLNKMLGTNEALSVAQILRMPDVVSSYTSSAEEKKLWTKVQKAINIALLNLEQSRKVEGARLKKDLIKRCRLIEVAISKIKKRIIAISSSKKTTISKKDSASNTAKERQNQDLLNSQKNIDVTEEIVRLASHTKTFRQTVMRGGELGRKIDFIAQEIVRETNTTGAKCNDFLISEQVIEIKSEIEKIREQAMNLE